MPKVAPCYVQGNPESGNVFMTSGFQPPTNLDLVDRSNISSYMQAFASGGSIEHVFLGGKVTNELKKSIIDRMFSTPQTYITLSPVVSFCSTCGTKTAGEHHECPHCHDAENMMVYARIIGYVRPIVSGKIRVENGVINGTENYWQDARREDWVERHKL